MGPVLTVQDITGCTSLYTCIGQMLWPPGFDMRDTQVQHLSLPHAGYVVLYPEALLIGTPSLSHGPDPAFSEVFLCAIQRNLYLTNDTIGTSPLPQAATI